MALAAAGGGAIATPARRPVGPTVVHLNVRRARRHPRGVGIDRGPKGAPHARPPERESVSDGTAHTGQSGLSVRPETTRRFPRLSETSLVPWGSWCDDVIHSRRHDHSVYAEWLGRVRGRVSSSARQPAVPSEGCVAGPPGAAHPGGPAGSPEQCVRQDPGSGAPPVQTSATRADRAGDLVPPGAEPHGPGGPL